MRPAAILALFPLLAASPPAPRDEFGDHLAALASPRADERAEAERWLAAHLVLERYPELAAAARTADAEVRGRLERVLGADERHLAVALELCAEKDPALATLGRDAVRAGVARFEPRLGEQALRGGELEFLLERAATGTPPRVLRLDVEAPLEELVADLDLFGELPLGLTLDPRLGTRTLRRPEAFAPAPWNELLARICRSLAVDLEGHGLARGKAADSPTGGFLRFVLETDPPRNGVELVGDWLVELATAGDEAARTSAAVNLAASGFTPAFAWMERRVRERGDAAARAGLLRAAAHGSVAPVLTAPGVLEPLLAEAESGARSAEIVTGLARAACFDGAGNALSFRLLAGLDRASPRARWTRFVLLERTGCTASEAAPLARAALADPATRPALRLAALHLLAALQLRAAPPPTEGVDAGVAPRVEGLAEVFRVPLDEDELGRLGRELALLGVEPPFRDPAAIPAAWGESERLALLATWIRAGALEPVAAHAAAWLKADGSRARGERLAKALGDSPARWTEPHLADVVRRARELAPDRAKEFERVRLLLGLVPAAEVSDVLERGSVALAGAQADLAVLGALGGSAVPGGADRAARNELLVRLGAALAEEGPVAGGEELVAALERTLGGMYTAGRDREGDAFATAVRTAVRKKQKSPLAARFGPTWPPAPGIELRDLARERARFEVPADL